MRASPLLQAALWMTGAIGSFSAMAVAGREVAVSLDTFELLLYRSLIGILIVVGVAGYARTLPQINTRNFNLHLIRNIGHFTGQNLWFFAVTVIPLAQVFALEFTSPLWVLVLSPLVLGERLTRVRAIAAGLGFIGVMIITRPGATALSPGVIAAALAAIGFAISALFTRRLTRTTSITCILFWLTAMQSVFGLITAGFDGDIALPSISALPWVFLIACAGLVAHFCLTKALGLAPASVVIPIDFTRLPLIALIGLAFYGEALDMWIILGGAVIIAANIINLRAEARGPHPQ
ncbi:MAG: DMT family transporter [Rhodobacteraceae bacterium]|nr:DMT family transporter [Paracoccaceae bacterium]